MSSAEQPVFSIIIAAFNAEATLARAVDSILAQSFTDYEVIVVDDGSTDQTDKAVAGYGNRVRYFRQDNAGVSAARNQGAQLAKGRWLAFLDADDWYYPQRLARQAELLQQNPLLDFVIADYELGRPSGEVLRRSISGSEFGRKLASRAGSQGLCELNIEDLGQLCADYFGHTSTFSLPRETFLKLGGYDRRFSIGEDLHLLIRLCAISSNAGAYCEPLAFYCVHDDGLMRSNSSTAQVKTVETLKSLKPVLKQAPKPVKAGFSRVLAKARFDLAFSLARQGHRFTAAAAAFPALLEDCSAVNIKRLLSVLKG